MRLSIQMKMVGGTASFVKRWVKYQVNLFELHFLDFFLMYVCFRKHVFVQIYTYISSFSSNECCVLYLQLVHCGCIVTLSDYFLHDLGGITCVDCWKINFRMVWSECALFFIQKKKTRWKTTRAKLTLFFSNFLGGWISNDIDTTCQSFKDRTSRSKDAIHPVSFYFDFVYFMWYIYQFDLLWVYFLN